MKSVALPLTEGTGEMPPAAPLRRGGAFPFRRKTLVSDPYLKACGTTGPTGCGSQKNLLGSFFSFLDRFWIVMDRFFLMIQLLIDDIMALLRDRTKDTYVRSAAHDTM